MNLRKKMRNVWTLYYYLTMNKDFTSHPEKIKAYQNKRIHRVMKAAYKIPFYRERFEASGTTPADYHCSEDLVKFPTINKQDLRSWMEQTYDNATEKERDQWQLLKTSGSSGTPLKVLLTHKEQGYSNANWIRVLRVAGYKPLFGKMYSFQTSHKDPNDKSVDSFVQKLGLMRRKVVSEDYCVGDGIADTIRDINAYKPQMLCFRRNCLVRIAMYAKQHNMPLWRPDYYVPVSEMVDEVTRNLLHETFGPGLIDAYGSTETGSCVIQFPGDDYYHVLNDLAVANVYDDNNQLADNGKIILTSLFKTSFPIINYDVGDLGESYVDEKSGLRYYKSIQGRMNDLVKHENGVESSALELMKIANGTVGLAQFRFIQESYHDMYIQLSPDPNNKTKTQEEITDYFVKSVQKLYGDEFKIRVEWMDILPPDETGKQRCFACKMK